MGKNDAIVSFIKGKSAISFHICALAVNKVQIEIFKDKKIILIVNSNPFKFESQIIVL